MATAAVIPSVLNSEQQTAVFRDYTDANVKFYDRVHQCYIKQHAYQTVEFVKKQHERFDKLDKVPSFDNGVTGTLRFNVRAESNEYLGRVQDARRNC